MRALSFVFLLAIAVFIRAPFVSKDLPYFYNEDEAHHFNRVVTMVKEGSFDPQYFHKPSFHFYLRMPVVAASFLWEVSKGRIRSLQEIVTNHPDGVAKYAFGASHPGIVKWNRAFSLLLSVLSVLLVFLIAKTLELSPLTSFTIALVCALSPALVTESCVIGVDVVVVFLALLTTLLALVGVQSRDGGRGILLSAFVAGLTVSTKYNALPIILVPAVAALSVPAIGLGGAVAAIVVSTLSFFAGSPFIFKHFNLFLDQFAYEIWHYKIAGHEGHSGTPGIQQFLFYGSWFVKEAVGWGVAIGAALGVLCIFKVNKKTAATVLVFPLLYLYLMSEQRANFTRNMLVVIPYLAILFGVTVETLVNRSRAVYLVLLAFGIAALFPLLMHFRAEQKALRNDSRSELASWIEEKNIHNVAVERSLQLAPFTVRQHHLTEVAPATTVSAAMLQGFEYLASYPFHSGSTPVLGMGTQSKGARIVQDPMLAVYKIDRTSLTAQDKRSLVDAPEVSQVAFTKGHDGFVCRGKTEEYCWLQTTISKVSIPEISQDRNFGGINGFVTLELETMTPWNENKAFTISFRDFMADVTVPNLNEVGIFQKITVKLPYQEFRDEKGFFVNLPKIASPRSEGTSEDDRRLGIAIRSIKVLQQ